MPGLWRESKNMDTMAIGTSAPKTKVAHRPANSALLSLQIRKTLARDHSPFTLDVAFDANSGFTILFGASGAGKTTLLDCIAGLIEPERGKIRVGERLWFDRDAGLNLPVQSRKIGYVFQDLALFPHLSVEQNLAYGIASVPRGERDGRISQILESFRIPHLRSRKPRQISGGERQRVALARALVTDPSVLLLDEPLSALDAPTKSAIIDDLRIWNAAHRIPILYVTHSRDEVFALGEQVLVLERGRLVAQGTPHEVMTAPLQETVAQLVGFENIFDAEVISIHSERGTMSCRIANGNLEFETPLVRAEMGAILRVGIGAGDILLASVQPVGLSARNLIPGRLVSLQQRDMIVAAIVDCGVPIEVKLTLAARDDLRLQVGKEVWLIVKTHSCHLMARS
jgi:molybdate transport system ATP-binding protein